MSREFLKKQPCCLKRVRLCRKPCFLSRGLAKTADLLWLGADGNPIESVHGWVLTPSSYNSGDEEKFLRIAQAESGNGYVFEQTLPGTTDEWSAASDVFAGAIPPTDGQTINYIASEGKGMIGVDVTAVYHA